MLSKMNIIIWKLLVFCLSSKVLLVNSLSYKDYTISYRIKIVSNNHVNSLVNDCLITSIPNGFRVPKEETDIQYTDLVVKDGSSLCERAPNSFANGTAMLVTTGSSGTSCGLVQQIRNARATNIRILVVTSQHKRYLPDIEAELRQYPIVVLMPSAMLDKVDKYALENSKIGIYGSLGSNRVGDTLTGLLLFVVVVLTLVFIILVTIVFNNQHFTHLDNINTNESKSIKWLVLICPIMMVGTLLLMYYFYNALVWVLIMFFYFGASFSVMTLAMLFFEKFNWLPHWVYPLNKCGIKNLDYRRLCFFAIGLAIATAWIINRNNMTGLVLNNILGVLLCVEIAVGFGILFVVSKNFKLLLVLLAATLVIDAAMVYIPVGGGKMSSNLQVEAFLKNDSVIRSRRTAGESIMESVATGRAGNSTEELPIRFKIPRFNVNPDLSTARCHNYSRTYSMIGFGDIILPGAFIVYILTYAVMETSSAVLYSLFILFCYILGLIITYVVVQFTERGQPALVFLLPCTVLPTLLLTAIKRDLVVLWRHSWPSNQTNIFVDNDNAEMITPESHVDDKVPL